MPVDAFAFILFFFQLLRILVSTSNENSVIFVVREIDYIHKLIYVDVNMLYVSIHAYNYVYVCVCIYVYESVRVPVFLYVSVCLDAYLYI